jgi:hypothetical protein
MVEVSNVTYLHHEINPKLRELVTNLLDSMFFDFGSKFTQKWGGVEPEKLVIHWCNELKGFTPNEIKRGIEAQKELPEPPDLRQFKRLCRPPLDSTVAYYEAIAGIEARKIGEPGTWSHPAIFWAAMPLSFDLAHQTFSQVRVRWEAALKDQLEKGEWAEIPKPLLAVEYRKNNLSKKDASEFLESIGVDKMTQKKGSLDWAHRILNNQKSKVRTYPMISIQFAKEALTNSGRAVDEF